MSKISTFNPDQEFNCSPITINWITKLKDVTAVNINS
jgi:hypothetical protein